MNDDCNINPLWWLVALLVSLSMWRALAWGWWEMIKWIVTNSTGG